MKNYMYTILFSLIVVIFIGAFKYSNNNIFLLLSLGTIIISFINEIIFVVEDH
ncbi:hypothetical protein [Dethiothermospora halolimnae]|uniref:hypothetical protein n=1 Tax=Dethiothermospora halolimnae TaxID=3114390 RepID=UPI003CCB956D